MVDFAAIPIWLEEKVDIAEDTRQLLKTSEILRRCEGVGRLLLRQPGECIVMDSKRNSPEGKIQYSNDITKTAIHTLCSSRQKTKCTKIQKL